MAKATASVVIPNFNGLRFLRRLMESLAAQSEPAWTALVVDDASTDGSVGYLSRDWPAVRLIVNRTNAGFAASCNRGLRAAETPFVVLLNNDTHVDPNWLREGLAAFQSPDVAAVASLVLLADPPHLIDTAGDMYSVVGGAVKRAHLLPPQAADSLSAQAFSACGASAFYRRDSLVSVGLLDERLESYYEDVDVGFRLAWAGYRCLFAPRSVCYHHLSSSYDPKGWRYHCNSARNAEIVWWSYLPKRLRRRYLLSHLAFLALQAGHKLRQGCLLPYVAGKWQAVRRLGQIRDKRRALREIVRVDDRAIEDLLVRDWWSLHVGSRLASGATGGATAENDGGAA
jgi:GT2 family glycosyltransferase